MTIALILGHSLCKWLERHLRLGSEHRLVSSFNIKECCKVHMMGGHVKRPDVVILMIGDDVNADTSPEMVVLATFLHRKYKVSHIVLCQLMTRFSETLHKAGVEGVLNQDKEVADKICKETYCKSAKEINDIVLVEVAAYDYITFWDHNGNFAFDRPQVGEIFRPDGIHLSPKGQWHLYKSIRVTLLNDSFKLQQWFPNIYDPTPICINKWTPSTSIPIYEVTFHFKLIT
ncbi:hypothetical protein ACJMK2_025729 [Sinanodonta woodiana]|uniref:Uncharacterized protein n=1 Tax=Sinanodonta woodiana TaxID=1069815 RepID=A0ABD3XKV9_SINWO